MFGHKRGWFPLLTELRSQWPPAPPRLSQQWFQPPWHTSTESPNQALMDKPSPLGIVGFMMGFISLLLPFRSYCPILYRVSGWFQKVTNTYQPDPAGARFSPSQVLYKSNSHCCQVRSRRVWSDWSSMIVVAGFTSKNEDWIERLKNIYIIYTNIYIYIYIIYIYII